MAFVDGLVWDSYFTIKSNQMQTKKLKTLSYLIIVLFVSTASCKKESIEMNQAKLNDAPANAIREIVGNKGTIHLLSNQQIYELRSSRSDANVKDSNTKLLTIQEFRKIYHDINNIEYIRIDLDSNLNKKKSSSEYADDNYDDDPGKPGLHKVQFYAAPFSYFNGTYGINNSNIPLSILNLWYETDIHGKVIGTPLLFFTGISFLQTWTQLIVTSIMFNQNNYTSHFSVGGTTLYGINLFGQQVGWTSSSRYIITVSMDSNNGEDGKITIKAEQN